jgi:hypothetical protein
LTTSGPRNEGLDSRGLQLTLSQIARRWRRRDVIERCYDVIVGRQANGSTYVAVLDLARYSRGKVINLAVVDDFRLCVDSLRLVEQRLESWQYILVTLGHKTGKMSLSSSIMLTWDAFNHKRLLYDILCIITTIGCDNFSVTIICSCQTVHSRYGEYFSPNVKH